MSDLPAGAELDRLVIERIMKWTLYHYDKAGQRDQYWMLLDEEGKAVIYSPRPGVLMTEFAREADAFAWFSPSTNIAHAFEVVEKLIGSLPEGDLHIEHHGDTGWGVSSCYGGKHWDDWVFAETLPLAICRAALKAAQS